MSVDAKVQMADQADYAELKALRKVYSAPLHLPMLDVNYSQCVKQAKRKEKKQEEKEKKKAAAKKKGKGKGKKGNSDDEEEEEKADSEADSEDGEGDTSSDDDDEEEDDEKKSSGDNDTDWLRHKMDTVDYLPSEGFAPLVRRFLLTLIIFLFPVFDFIALVTGIEKLVMELCMSPHEPVRFDALKLMAIYIQQVHWYAPHG
jgi:hypothetical protein